MRSCRRPRRCSRPSSAITPCDPCCLRGASGFAGGGPCAFAVAHVLPGADRRAADAGVEPLVLRGGRLVRRRCHRVARAWTPDIRRSPLITVRPAPFARRGCTVHRSAAAARASRRRSSRARTTSRPSWLAIASSNARNVFGPSARASATACGGRACSTGGSGMAVAVPMGKVRSKPALRANPGTPQGRVEGYRAHAGDDNEVAVSLESRGQRPVHLRIGENIDVWVDNEHMLDVRARSERRGDGVARLARRVLPSATRRCDTPPLAGGAWTSKPAPAPRWPTHPKMPPRSGWR